MLSAARLAAKFTSFTSHMSMRFSALLVFLACLTSVELAGQDVNVKIVKQFDTRGRLSGVWGLGMPDGREFAVVGEYGGTWIVETTNPSRPVEIAHFSGPNSRWREITAYQNIVYSVSEHHRGIRIIDMSNPNRPVDRGYVFTSRIPSAHTISVDPDAGRLFVNGTASGQLILDVSKTPLSPVILGYFTGEYVHDCYVRRGFGYYCEIYTGNLRVVDVTNPASVKTVAVIGTPGGFTHSCGVTADDALLVTVDENTSPNGYGLLQLWDIRNKARPVKKGFYTIGTPEICHNPYVLGRVGYMAYNSAGFHMCDLTDVTKPSKLASFDSNKNISGYTGMWGCYPFQDSGIVYGSDRDNGLQIMQILCAHMNRYGSGTAPATHAIPRIEFDGAAPRVGASGLELHVSGLQPNASFVLAISAASVAPKRILGVDVHIDLAGALLVNGRVGATGRAILPAAVPNDPRLGGARVYMQMFASDSAAPFGLSASRGMWAGICR
ncbi:MAG: choice-of-anchor B family protein [Planctomycetota bacterium]|nr:choice-of-anchor B family protein [Planctomycetota bacterium]